MLVLDRLGHRYPGTDRPALDAVSLHVRRGEVLGLLGPNGAGKTTLISHLAGALPVREGRILIDDVPLAQVRAKAPTRIAVAPQDYAFYSSLTVAENLACFAGAAGLSGENCTKRVDACLDFAQLQAFAAVQAERLSGGLKRRLNLAIALLPEPELVLFDEPTVGVDPQSRAFILAAIRALADGGAAVIYASHYMEEIEALADRIAILDHGRLLREGSLAALLADDARTLRLRAVSVDAGWLAGFGDVSRQGDQWVVRLHDGVQPIELLNALAAKGVPPQQFDFGRGNLEQLFMALTHRPLRDIA